MAANVAKKATAQTKATFENLVYMNISDRLFITILHDSLKIKKKMN